MLLLGHEKTVPWIAKKQNGNHYRNVDGGKSRSIFSVSSQNHEDIYRTLRYEETKLKLADLIQFGQNADKNTVLYSAQWLQKDLPVRMGHRVQVGGFVLHQTRFISLFFQMSALPHPF